MKKIRMLALLLAILMIPFSFLFACDKDPVDDPDDKEEENPNNNNNNNNNNQNVVLDDDGKNDAGGYLMYFHFNAAGNGMLGIVEPSTDTTKPESEYVLEKPYSTYLEGSLVSSASYTVRSAGDRSFFAMERRGGSGSPTLKIKVAEAFRSDIDADHMLQFELYFEKGYFKSPVDVYGSKNAGKAKLNLLTIEDGLLKDGNGTVIYGEKSTDKSGWITVTILISEQARKYDIYVDGIRQTDKVSIGSSYPIWDEYRPESYSIQIRATGNENTYVYLDNLCMKSNVKENEIYKGADEAGAPTAEVPANMPIYNEEVFSNNYSPASLVRNTPFGSALLMSESLCVSKITPVEDNVVYTDLYDDYGAYLGNYTDGKYSIFYNGNAYFTEWVEGVTTDDPSKVDRINHISYDSDKTDDVAAIEGTYTISGLGVITVDWGENAAPTVADTELKYAKYSSETLTFYTDATCATAIEGATYTFYKAAEKYAYGTYASHVEGTNYVLRVDPFLGVANLKVTSAEGDETEDAYAYTVDGNKVTVNSVEFTYNEAKDVFSIGTVNLVKKAGYTLGENEKLAFKYTNWKSNGITQLTVPIDTEWWQENCDRYGNFVFEFYASNEMVEDGYQFLLKFSCGNSLTESGKEAYYAVYFDCDNVQWNKTTSQIYTPDGNSRFSYVAGYNRVEINLGKAAITRDAAIERIKNVAIVTTGWSNGPSRPESENNDTAYDGYTLYITEMSFMASAIVTLTPPALGKEDCLHKSGSTSLMVPVADPVPSNCQHGTYYIKKCSECGATDVDRSRPFGAPEDHVYGSELKLLKPTCDVGGYYYYECTECGYHLVDSNIPAKGHTLSISADWTERVVTSFCTVCGYEKSEKIFESLIPFSEKLTGGVVDPNRVLYAAPGNNDNINYTTTEQKGFGNAGLNGGLVNGPLRDCSIKTVEVAGKMAFEIKHNNPMTAKSNHSYFSYTSSVTGHEAGTDWVLEFDFMPGAKKADGKYNAWEIVLVDSSGTYASRIDTKIFGIDNDACVYLSSVTNITGESKIQLDVTKFTNIALLFSSTDNKLAIYIDGKLASEGTFAHSKYPDASGVSFNAGGGDLRFGPLSGAGVCGSSTYINNIAFYYSNIPACVLSSVQVTEEASGKIDLKDTSGYDMLEDFNVGRIDVVTNLSVEQYTTKYVLEFAINGRDLSDGVILSGRKRGVGFDRTEDILYIEDGMIYCLGRMISTSTENVKIALSCDDTTGSVTVYVNGTAIDGTLSYRTSAYADVNGRVRSFTFSNECGAYEISGLKMYTGLELQA